VREPALVAAASERMPVAVGLDHRGGEVAVHGWTEGTGLRLADLLDRYPSAAAFVVTDISRDGMLAGPDVEGLREVASQSSIPIIASGGISSLEDLQDLARLPNVVGAITGKALYEGRFTLAAALEVLR
jgi:phosphoribosylformimino-5-aminoimidazole carboxamide ribotide isomerase